ncbi:hypothetical protein [Ectopseudomonas toyotomiensis]|uniref:Uncharacterized protein n=1 Tax=Ectopseudomonas toyotomiensis TaxID=554344 RepID=A0AA42LG76_9GAMM|nr:hypothetical protein [Pseudomonas toyotomiensis]MBG0839021.1 hypothetical protein [Pseudomonas toyotomiensis]MDH0699904.1 hypothetical protein [Pseudomonas toyotomiensis]
MYGLPKRKHAANGGLIEGPGTGTSDSIKKDVPAGTYILPADTTAQLGLGMPGRNGQGAPAQEQPRLGMPGKQVPVAVSSGEYEMPPQDVHALGALVLDQLKNATHQQKGFGLTKAVMAAKKGQQADGPRQFFVDGGLVEDRERRGFGLNLPTTTLAQQNAPRLGVPGNNAQAAPAQAEPRAGGFGMPRAGQQPAATQQPGLGMPRRTTTPPTQQDAPRLGMPGAARGLLDVPAGIGQAVAGAAQIPIAAGRDALRNVAAYAVGGDPSTLPGGAARYRDEAVSGVQQGLDRIGGATEGLRAAGREALGVQPREGAGPAPAAAPAPTSTAGMTPERIQTMARESAAMLPEASAPSPDEPEFVSPAGNGYTQAGSGIAMRTGADGTPEFTNDTAAVSGARTMPAGGMNRIGDGVGGGLSVGDPGDAEMAIARFQRANDIRQRALEQDRGTVTGLTDDRGNPSLAERQRSRLNLQNAEAEALRTETQQGSATASQQLAAENQRMGTEQLNQQRLQQQIAEGDIGVQDRQRLDQLRAQINDPNLSEQQRAQAMEAYNALSITPDARLKAQQDAETQQNRLIGDLYKSFSSLQTPPTIGEGANARPMSFDEWLQPALRAIQGGGQQGQQQARTSVSRAEVEQTARARGISPEEVIRRLQGVGVTVSG